jgi:hypothetical protein
MGYQRKFQPCRTVAFKTSLKKSKCDFFVGSTLKVVKYLMQQKLCYQFDQQINSSIIG